MKKILLLAIVALFTSTAVQAQIGKSRIVTKSVSYTNELDLYIQNGWGVGYQLRREFNPYIGWNIIGLSYMSGFKNGLAEVGQFNAKFLGVRAHTPTYKSVRGYVDLNLGYTFAYDNREPGEREVRDDVSHNIGVDFGLGVQVHKNIAIGYNLNLYAGSVQKKVENGSDDAIEKSHWFKLAFLF